MNVLTCGLVVMAMLGTRSVAAPSGHEVYVDARHGDDRSGSGTLESPWKTLQFAAARMKVGAECMIREGVYREMVTPRDGQVFRAYRGERVVISGCDVVTVWQKSRGGVRTASLAASALQVFVDGERMHKARFPDEDGDMYNTVDWAETVAERARPGGTGRGEVTFTAGLEGKSFNGGFFTGLNGKNAYQANMGRILGTEGSTIVCDHTNLRWYRSRPGQFEGKGRGYITDHLNTLSTAKEWHWQDGFLHLIPPNGKPLEERTVEARTRLWGFDCSGRKGVRLEGLAFRAASVLMDGSTDCVIDGCEFTYVSPWGRFFDMHSGGDPEHYSYGCPEDGTSGITISGSGNAIRNCRVARGWGALITVRGKRNTVENNLVEEANWQCREFAVNIIVNGQRHRILRNTVRKSTAMLIVMIDIDRVPTTTPLIKLNDCRDYGYIMLDGGTAAIYQNGNNDLAGAEVSYNFITDNRTTNQRVSSGIYFDDGAYDFRVHHNVILGGGRTRCGLFTHRGNREMLVYNNTFWGQRQGGWISAVWKGQRDSETMIYRNNLSSGQGFVAHGVKGTITQDHNREDVPEDEFVDVKGLDFQIRSASSPSVNAGVLIEGGMKVFDGKPDLGAYERGVHWKAGADLGKRGFARKHVVVRKPPTGRAYGWPANGGVWSWGNEILVMYLDCPYKNHPGFSNHDSDQKHRSAKWVTSRSHDGGETWTEHRTAFSDLRAHPEGSKPVSLKAPIDFSDRRTILNFHWDGLGVGARTYFYYSNDKGKTWHGPYDNIPLYDFKGMAGRTDYEVTGKHRLTAYLSCIEEMKGPWYRESTYSFTTTDGGMTWRKGARMSRHLSECRPGANKIEYGAMSSTVRIDANTLVSAFRSGITPPKGRRTGWIDVTRSTDNGRTWRVVNGHLMDLPTLNSSPPALSRLPGGRLVCSWGYRLPDDGSGPTAIQARTSDDNGQTWNEMITLRRDGFDYDIGYNRQVVRPDGKVVTIYYWRTKIDGQSPTYIAATIWDAHVK